MTQVIYFSGVHGAGKTTVIRKVAQRLQKAGLSVFVFDEFTFIPDIPIGTSEFQLWYNKQMTVRNELIAYLLSHNSRESVDYILCDRHFYDYFLYSIVVNDLAFDNNDILYDFIRKKTPLLEHSFFVTLNRSTSNILDSIHERMETETHRKEWKENDKTYLNKIQTLFSDTFDHVIHPNIPQSCFINNRNLIDTVDIVMRNILNSELI